MHSTCLAKVGAMCGIPLSVLSPVTGLAISLHGNSRLAASTYINSLHSLLLKHLVILCNHGLHSAFLWAVGCPVACLSTNVAVPRESATLILLRADWSHSGSENWNFSSNFAVAFSSFCLGSSPGIAGSTSSASSRLACSTNYCHCSTAPVISPHERGVILLSN